MVSPEDLPAAVERVFPGALLRAARRLTGGVSADVHALDLEWPDGPRRTVVLRRHRAEWKARHGQVAQMEYEVLRALHTAGLPVPEPLLLDTSGALLPEPFLVMEFVEGSIDVPADRLDASLDLMAAALLRVHSLPPGKLPDLPPRTDPLPELFDYLSATGQNLPLREHLSRCTDSAYEGEPVLLHGDYWPGNLLWRQGRLAAILDWEDAASGDPWSDVASCRLELLWKYGSAAMNRFTAAYARERAIDHRRLALWQLFCASAAIHFMGAWGLEPAREAEMRKTALVFAGESANILLTSGAATI